MPHPKFLSIAEQVAAHLKQELRRGRWSVEMPGRHEVAAELRVSDQTAEAGLAQLEREGILVPQGPGRRRRIELPEGAVGHASLRVAILVGEPGDRRLDFLGGIKHGLNEAGHAPFFTPWCVPELGMEVRSIAGRLKRTEADAWIVVAAARSLLEWFLAREVPVFALFGRRRRLPVAGVGPDKPPAMAHATRRLIGLGHRRIVFLALRAQRLPEPGAGVQAFFDELARHGIQPGPYHLPDWEENLDSFHECLAALFRHRPPTALIVDEPSYFVAVMQFLLNRRLRVPEDVSLICTDDHPLFARCRPPVTHIRCDLAPVVRRAVRWTGNLARGKRDVRQTLTKAEFIEGGTIGPAPAGKT